MFNKKDIANKIYNQMAENFVSNDIDFIEEIKDVSYEILSPSYVIGLGDEPVSLYDNLEPSTIKKHLFCGFKKALHPQYKFDSMPERNFAIVCESDNDVLKWLRPAPMQFNLIYDKNKRYIPDFVVEDREFMYLVEIKGEDRLNDKDVLEKKQRAIKYCQIASEYCLAKEMKAWKHLFIPSKAVQMNTSFNHLVRHYQIK